MNRIRVILGISHVLFVGAAVALYADEPIVISILGVPLFLVACFVRMMVPYPKAEPKKIAENVTQKVLSVMQFLGLFLVIYWLFDIGLIDIGLIDKVLAERFSALPIIGFSVLITSAFIRDWRWMLGLSNDEVEAFYAI